MSRYPTKFAVISTLLLIAGSFATGQVEFRDQEGFQFYEGNISMNDNRILGLPEPESSGEPLIKGSGSGFVERGGDSMTGDLDLQDNYLLGDNASLDFSSGELLLNQDMPDSGSPTTIQLNQNGEPNWAFVSMQDGGLGIYDAQAGEMVMEFNENGSIEFLNREIRSDSGLDIGGSINTNRKWIEFDETQGIRITPGNTSVSDSSDNSDLELHSNDQILLNGGDAKISDGDLAIGGGDLNFGNGAGLHEFGSGMDVKTADQSDGRVDLRDSYYGQNILEANVGGKVSIPNGNLDTEGNNVNLGGGRLLKTDYIDVSGNRLDINNDVRVSGTVDANLNDTTVKGNMNVNGVLVPNMVPFPSRDNAHPMAHVNNMMLWADERCGWSASADPAPDAGSLDNLFTVGGGVHWRNPDSQTPITLNISGTDACGDYGNRHVFFAADNGRAWNYIKAEGYNSNTDSWNTLYESDDAGIGPDQVYSRIAYTNNGDYETYRFTLDDHNRDAELSINKMGWYQQDNTRGYYLRRSGDDMRGSIDMNGNDINNAGTINANTKNFVQEINATHEAVYTSQESPKPRAVIEDSSKLNNGERLVEFPAHFSRVISKIEPMFNVQLTPKSSNTYGLSYTMVNNTHLKVEELANQTNSIAFDYRVTAIREGYEDKEVVREQ